jgi:hypothetical protein
MSLPGRLPYPGLRAFTREESDLFFGREGSVDTMVDCLAANRFMAVLGPSGSGKSSLVRTGLLDALELGLLAGAGSHWKIADMHPGGQPIRKLAESLLSVRTGVVADEVDIDLMTSFLRQGPRSVVEWARAGNIIDGFNLLILVDQFEELFRYADYAQREEAQAFAATLLEASASPDIPIYVVITMRSEYLGACASIEGLAERISTGLYLAPRMDRDECREAIEGPASVLGFKVENALVNRLLNDLASFAPWQEGEEGDLAAQLARQADQLPLMQHVLNRLWLRAAEDSAGKAVDLTLGDYDQIGGLSGALDAHGAEIIASLGQERIGAIENVFRALVVGNSLATAVRRPCRMKELVDATGGRRDDVEAIVNAFRAQGCNFLRTSDASLDKDDVIVDISHESLIRQWTPLRQWLEKEARDGAEWRRLASAEERYRLKEGGLLTGLDYQSSSAWWAAVQPNAIWAQRNGGNFESVSAFLQASRAAEEEYLHAEQQRQRRERSLLIAGVAALTVLVMVISALSYEAAKKAKDDRIASAAAANNLTALVASQKQLLAAQQVVQMRDRIQLATLHDLKITNAELQDAQRRNQSTLTELNNALHRAEAATQEAKSAGQLATRGAQRLTETLDDVSSIISDKYGNLIGGGNLRATLMDEIRSKKSDIENQYPNVIDDDSRIRDDYRSALAYEAIGNIPEELVSLQKGYEDGIKVISISPTGKTLPSEELLADFLNDSERYVWLLYDVGETEKGTAALHHIEEIESALTSHYKATHTSPNTSGLDVALANVENLEGRYFYDQGDQKQRDLHTKLAFNYAMDAQTRHDANLGTSTRAVRFYLNQWKVTNGKEADDYLAKGCTLGNELYAKIPFDTRAIDLHIECLSEQAYDARYSSANETAQQKLDAAQLKYKAAEDVALGALQFDPENQELLLWMARLENYIAELLGPTSVAADRKLSAKDYFVRALKGKTVSQSSTDLLVSVYNDCKAIIFAKPDDELQFYTDIVESMSQTTNAFPKATGSAYIAGDAAMHVGRLLAAKPGRTKEAIGYFSESLTWFDRSGSLKDLSTDDGNFAAYCSVYVDRAALYGTTNRPDLMLADTVRMKQLCSPALEKYPYDFHLREQFIKSNADTGKALFDLHRYNDAMPFLQYASHWSDKDSSSLLARIYREGLLGSADPAKATTLDALAAKQTTQSFTFPVDFNGIKFPEVFVIRQWPDDYPYKGIDDQVTWWKKTQGVTVDPDIAKFFLTIFEHARENDASYPQYCDDAINHKQPTPEEKRIAAQTALEKTAYARALDLAKHQKGRQAGKATEDFLKIDPNSIAVLQSAANIYHEQLYDFDRALQLDERRMELGDTDADLDLVEANLTASHYETCASMATAISDETTEDRIAIIMTSLDFACYTGEGRQDAALAAGNRLRNKLTGLKPVKWDFSGTEHFVGSRHPFSDHGAAWAALFDALQTGKEEQARTALTSLGIPAETATSR